MTNGARQIRTRRVYDPLADDDGARVLVDRVWPRGLAKDAARLDAWLKEVAPSTELRRWYQHDPERYADFAGRYRAELAQAERQDDLRRLADLAEAGPLTLLTATKDVAISHARVLCEVLQEEA